MKTESISTTDLFNYGFEPGVKGDSLIFKKEVAPGNEELGPILLGVTTLYNEPEFCLVLPEGQTMYLNVNSLESLEIFEKSINRYEPVW